VPPLPPQLSLEKLKGNESEAIQKRKIELDYFLKQLTKREGIKQSNVLRNFLTMST